jgi:hypothetical protein
MVHRYQAGTFMLAVFAIATSGAGAQQGVVLPEQDVLLRDRPVDVWSEGRDEGESWQMLSRVTAAAFDAQDNLYVLDAGNFRVLVFAPDGRYLRTIGKQGGGPGELQSPGSLAIDAGQRLIVAEARGFSIFTRDGEFVRLVPAHELGPLRLDAFGAHPDGGVLIRSRTLPQPGEAPRGERVPAPIVHLPLDMAGPADTVLALTEPGPVLREVARPGGRTMRIMHVAPPPTFSRTLRWTSLSDGRVAVAEEGDGYEIRIATRGRVSQILTRPLRPRAATERDRERARAAMRESLDSDGNRVSLSGGAATFSGGGRGMSEALKQQIMDEMTFAEQVAVVQDLFATAAGQLWVQRAPGVWGDPSPVDLIADDGRYIGTITGISLPLAASRSGLAVWVEKNDVDVERLHVRRLPESWR